MKLAIYGSEGLGREAYELVQATQIKWDEIIFVDDTKTEDTFRDRRLMSFAALSSKYSPSEIKFIIAVGEPFFREMLANRVKEKGYGLVTVIHPTASISPTAKLEDGAIVCMGAIVSSGAMVKSNVWLQPYALVGHDVIIKENSVISSLVAIGGFSAIERNTFVGLSASIRDRVTIGHDSIISMGAVVIKDINPERIAMGNPAREMAENKDKRVFKH